MPLFLIYTYMIDNYKLDPFGEENWDENPLNNEILGKILTGVITGNVKSVSDTLKNTNVDLNIPYFDGRNTHNIISESIINCRTSKILELFIDYGADINTLDEYFMYPILWSCSKKDKSFYDILIKNGADINVSDEDGYGCIYYSIINDRMSILEDLLRRSIDVTENDINISVDYQRIKALELFYVYGCEMDFDEIRDYAENCYSDKVIKWIDKNNL